MKITKFRAALVAALIALAPFSATLSLPAFAQTVVQVPTNINARAVADLGNGPTEIRVLQGNLGLFTAQGAGVGSTSGSSTALTLTATPTTVPCVGCIVSGTGITSATTVVSYNGGLTVGLSAAMTVASGTAVAWGAACPGAPPAAGIQLVQAAVGADFPMYTQARVCAYGGNGPGATILQFVIGAH
jgi:hypothetical protein